MSDYDVSEALDDLLEQVTLTRTATGSRVKGEYIAGAAVDTTIMAHDQSMSPSETLVFRTEGNERKNIRRVFSKVLLKVTNAKTGEVADFLTINGDKFKLISVDPWRKGGYYNSVIEEVN